MRERASRWLALVFLCTLALTAGCGSGASTPDGDSNPADGDTDADGDAPTDGDRIDGDDDGTERERPPVDPFVWEDDTIDSWTDTPFCLDGIVAWKDDFEDEDLTRSPAWSLDPKVEGNSTGDPTKVAWPATVFDDSARRFVISGDPEDTQSRYRTGRLYMTFGAEVNAFHMLTRLDGESGENLLWLGHSPDPTTSFGPQIQLFHLAEPRTDGESTGKQLVIDDETGDTWCDLSDLGPGWHRVELFRSGREWRLDLDRVTRCTFEKPIDSTRPLSHLFVGLRGQIDDVAVGVCTLPSRGRTCESDTNCVTREVCGRDGLCHATRTITCQSDLQCGDGTTCIGERDGGDMIGDGSCTELCSRHQNCRAGELCVPHTKQVGTCQSLCRYDGTCPAGQSCWEIGGVRGCLPDACKRNGEWIQRENGLLECVCSEGFVLNPFNNRCEFRGTCKTHSHCDYAEACGSDRMCHRNRDMPCKRDEACAAGMTCYGFTLDGVLAGSGQCMASCARDTDCLAYERCIPATPDTWACMQRCNQDSDCPIELRCVESYGGAKVCMAEQCQKQGVWDWSDDRQTFVCTCINGTQADINTGRCL